MNIQEDAAMSMVLMQMWADFIKTSNPGNFWEPADAQDQYLR